MNLEVGNSVVVDNPIEPLTAEQAIKLKMEELGLKQTDLAKYLGSKARVSEVLNGKRKLTLNMIRSLNQHLNIPLENLIHSA